MPNWTTNFIRINGKPADIRAFLDAVKSEDTHFDFNRIIPMPELLKHTGCGGGMTIDGQEVSSWYVIKEGNKDNPDEVRLFTPEEEDELAKIGHRNWYEWSCENWGTKWNASDPGIDATNAWGLARLYAD